MLTILPHYTSFNKEFSEIPNQFNYFYFYCLLYVKFSVIIYVKVYMYKIFFLINN